MSRMTVQIDVSDGKDTWKSRVLVFDSLKDAASEVVALLIEAWLRFEAAREDKGKSSL